MQCRFLMHIERKRGLNYNVSTEGDRKICRPHSLPTSLATGLGKWHGIFNSDMRVIILSQNTMGSFLNLPAGIKGTLT
jgi:hypothetical protein